VEGEVRGLEVRASEEGFAFLHPEGTERVRRVEVEAL
jgi:hypothetical protein